MKEPSKSKLESFLKTVREANLGCPTVSAADIEAWCEERSVYPSDEDEPFILKFQVFAESANPDEQDLNSFINTKITVLYSLVTVSPSRRYL